MGWGRGKRGAKGGKRGRGECRGIDFAIWLSPSSSMGLHGKAFDWPVKALSAVWCQEGRLDAPWGPHWFDGIDVSAILYQSTHLFVPLRCPSTSCLPWLSWHISSSW